MKAIILAAGEGTRLRPLTDTVPKCMVRANEKPLVEYQLEAFRRNNISNTIIVKGYKKEVLNYADVKYYVNERYFETNMVYSLFCAEAEFDDDILISYGDIVFTDDVLKKIVNADADFAMTVDKDWLKLWSERMENPLDDVETLKIDDENCIVELGKKPKHLFEVQAQFMGLIKIKKRTLEKVKQFYHQLDKTAIYEGKNFDNMFSTTFFQSLIDSGFRIKAIEVNGGWIEVDTVSDLKLFCKFLPSLCGNVNEK